MSHSVRCWLSFYLEMLCLLAAKVLILFELYDEKVWSGPSKTLCTMQYGLFEMGNWEGEVKIQNCETKCKTVNDMITSAQDNSIYHSCNGDVSGFNTFLSIFKRETWGLSLLQLSRLVFT
ncbi:hypothetical protein J7297_02153 [Nakaseomyces glabratus]|nr:hypothetical protein J7297_02153 [Nakaseomyces glabratus]KAH7592052.1 hypothetical protein J7296_02153 [Nakaseomyces glabratus]KAI8396717.1 hypothetical protein J6895_02172 [Nakaseomyces glabratus]